MSFDVHTRTKLHTELNSFLENSTIDKGETLYATYHGGKISFNKDGNGAKVPDSFLSRYENHYLNTKKDMENFSKIQNNVTQLRSGAGALKKLKNWFKALFNKRAGTNTFEKRLLEKLETQDQVKIFNRTSTDRKDHVTKIDYLLANRMLDNIISKGTSISVDKESVKVLKSLMERGASVGSKKDIRENIRVNDAFIEISEILQNTPEVLVSEKAPEPESESFSEHIPVEEESGSATSPMDEPARNVNIDPNAPPPPPIPTPDQIRNRKQAKKKAQLDQSSEEPSTVGHKKVGTAGSQDISPEQKANLDLMASIMKGVKKTDESE